MYQKDSKGLPTVLRQENPAKPGLLLLSPNPQLRPTFQKLRLQSLFISFCGEPVTLDCVPCPPPPSCPVRAVTRVGRVEPRGWQSNNTQMKTAADGPAFRVSGCCAQLPPGLLKFKCQPDFYLEASQPKHGTKVPSDKPIPGSKVCFYVCWQIELSPATITTLFPLD